MRLMRTLRKPRPLARATLELANAANGFRPLARKGYSTVLIFWFGWPASEVPGIYFSASLLDALRRGRRGDFAGRRGKAALALTAASWAILGVIKYRGITTPGPVLEAGLRDQLGDDYTEALNKLPQSRPTRSGRRTLPLGNIVARRRYVEKTNVVSYGPHGRANLADIWRRRDLPRDGKAPVLLQVPGGAWAIGMRRPQAYPLMSHLAARGWVCVSIGYRVSPRHTWPDHIVDVKRALAWVKENIARYGGDPNFVAITGGSAGGHLCSLAALTPNDPKYQPGFEDADTSVVAAVPVYGRYDWFTTEGEGRREFVQLLEKFVVKKKFATHRDIYVDASPIRRLRADAPPFFVLHGRDDSLIPVGEAQEFVEELRAVSKSPVAYAELPHAQHAFDIFSSPRAHRSAEAVARFLSWVYATNPPERD
ncbi:MULTISPECIES: alpha/beta hydrolase [Mycobacterium avium complex (MAC)]|uniref:Alpha/beta hydrolase n=1 Tax=Mycobacterium avium subsp. hominissuis TaxID=439334 RepID=A0A2A3L8N7_MYCAV|nr:MULTISPECIES: alpha/beta hydrolase [Mycobacterium avium complex (MAC)]ETB40622.1 esterase [Mycobacterium avium subsp. hominissuis 10-5606]ETZ59966.1 alpha/beta hydrolase fold family protein [Mycobacterium sp. MAC_011194_8550]ETZ67933.1 alpha/beta hydrolase fold family protein [Mycobacterium sp. MAC_080597_8934]MBZ4501213.1 alpha/beta hydrolase [Mycobacterium avium subsp. hominissuis]MBZ4520482.1 alpha/beta hydrolase [Mycobacterium avium subsp. hominissuis]